MPEIKGIRQVSLVVESFAESLVFYRDKLGFFENWTDDLGETASLSAGPTELYLTGKANVESAPEAIGCGIVVTFLVEDLEGLLKKATSAGLSPFGAKGQALTAPESRPNAERAFCLKDPSGYTICFAEKMPSFP
jgi:catechol 2,3-dioxygenase-like lactoylglutathione lyase family enzyme